MVKMVLNGADLIIMIRMSNRYVVAPIAVKLKTISVAKKVKFIIIIEKLGDIIILIRDAMIKNTKLGVYCVYYQSEKTI